MSLRIEAIAASIKNSILGSREELNKPSLLSISIRGTKIPGRELLADTLERARFSALGPINFARIMHEQIDMHPAPAIFMALGFPVGAGLMTMVEGGSIPLAIAAGVTTYMIEGCLMTNQSHIDDTFSRTARRVATFFSRVA